MTDHEQSNPRLLNQAISASGEVPVLVVGAGAIGGYFGSLLARAGHPVTMLARGAHLEAIRSRGFRIEEGPDAGVAAVQAVASLIEAPAPGLVLFAVKAYDSELLARQLASLVPDDALVLELQNGVDRADELRRLLGDRVLASTVYMESQIESPGIVRYLSGARSIHLGEPDGSGLTPRAAQVGRILEEAGIDARVYADVRPALWGKFVLVCAANSLTALTQRRFGDVIALPMGRDVVAGLIAEAVAVGEASGVDLGDDVVERSVAFLEDLGPRLRSSMLRDIERNRQVEVDALNGTVVRLGDELGVEVPMNRVVTLALRAHNERILAEEVTP